MEENQEIINNEDTISLLDLLLVLAKNLKFLIIFTFIFAFIAFGINILGIYLPSYSPFNLLPDQYESQVKILLKTPSSSGSSVFGSNSQVGSLLGLFGGGSVSASAETAELISELLRDKEVVDQIAEEFSLLEYYQVNTDFPKTKQREIFEKHIKTEFLEEANILILKYQDISPEFAHSIISRLVELLESKYKSLTLSQITDKKNFLYERVTQAEKEYKEAQQKLIEFQKQNGVLDISAQSSGTVQQILKLQIQIIQIEMEIVQLKKYYNENDPMVVRKENEKKQAQDLLNKYKNGFNEESTNIIPQDSIPDLSAKIFNLQQEITAQGTIYKLLREQYETARIEEKNSTAVFQIMEYPEIPEQKSAPSRFLLVVIITLAGFFLAVFISFIREYLERVKMDPVENQKMVQLKENLRLFHKKR